jgi:hypothetical protein
MDSANPLLTRGVKVSAVRPGAAAAIAYQHWQASDWTPTEIMLPIGRVKPNPSAEPVETS